MTKFVNTWRRLHRGLVGTLIAGWTIWIGLMALRLVPDTTWSRGVALGVAILLPHLWLGLSLWHQPERKGIGIPIAVFCFRFIGSLILFSIIAWQFPSENRIIAPTVASLIIVSTSIETFLFYKGAERL